MSVSGIQWQIQDFPLGGGADLLGGANLQHICFLVKTCENERIGSCWGGALRRRPLDPPMMQDAYIIQKIYPLFDGFND